MLKPVVNRSLLLAPLALLLPAGGLAEVDTSNWLCESCPFETGYRANIDAGATYVSDDAARFGNATGLDEKGAYANVDGRGSYAKGAYRLEWQLDDLGLDSRALSISGGLQGKFGFDIGYREMPYRLFGTTKTVFTSPGSDTLRLPGNWVSSGTTGGFTALAASLQPRDIGSDRQNIDLGAHWIATDRVRLYADFQRQNRDGYRISGGAGFAQATLLPRWFDYETDRIDAGIRYSAGNATVGLAYYGSFFTNNNAFVSWESPFSTSPGAEILQKSVAPGNDFQQILLNGTYRASVWDTIVAFSLASGRGEQNETLLPYTVNPTVTAGALPRASIDGQVDTSHYALTVTSRPVPKGRIRFTYRYDDRDNKTLQSDWNRVIVDLIGTGPAEQNVPYSFERTRIGLSGEYALRKGIKISGGYDRKELDRDYQEVAEQTVDAGWGQLRWHPLGWLDLRIKGGTEERDINRYDETIAVSVGQNPLMRKYNLARRFRSYGELVTSISPVDARWAFSMTLLMADDNYDKSQLGMTDSEERRATADLSFRVSDSFSTYFMMGREEIESLQLGSEQFAASDWSAVHNDDFDHVGVGARWQQPEGKFDFRLDYNRGVGETTINLDSQSGGASALPELESTLDSVRMEAGYRWSERLYGTLDLRYERFELNDWALVAPNTLPTVLTLGAEPYDYDLWAVGLGIRYSFGDRVIKQN